MSNNNEAILASITVPLAAFGLCAAIWLACHLAGIGFADTENEDFQEYAALGICEDTEGCYLDLDDIQRVLELSEEYPHFYDEYERVAND